LTSMPTTIRPFTAGNVMTLAWIETRRYVRNPVLIAALALTAWTLQPNAPAVTNVDTVIGFPAAFLGGLGLVASFRLSRSMKHCAEIVDVAPLDSPARTLALCLTSAVPFAAAGLSLLAFQAFIPLVGDHPYGEFGSADRAMILVSQIVICGVGGPLLCVALGRWISFEWAGLAAFLVIFGWIELTTVIVAADPDSLPRTMLRMFSPFTFFLWVNDDGTGATQTWRGSPSMYLSWQVALCALAVTVALLRGAEGRQRRRLRGALVVVTVLCVVTYLLAVTGAPTHTAIDLPG
jgi:hypothetical protein